jgi:hypothetical protein
VSTETREHGSGERPDWSPDPATLIPVGARVRHKRTGLMGRIKAHEWNRPGWPSAIPYNVEWDDNDEAYDRLGMMFIYADDDTIQGVAS